MLSKGRKLLLLALCTVWLTQLSHAQPSVGAEDVRAYQGGTWDEVGINDSGNSITVDGSVSCTLSEPISVDDNGSSLTVDGTVTVTDGAGALNVIVDSSALPTGAATAANQLPDGHNVTVDNGAGASAVNIQDGGNSITVDGTVTVTDGAGALNVIVDSSALPSGAATAANQTTQTTALQLIDDLVTQEDQASANADEGIVSLARRTASPANTSGTDGDYEALQMSAGRLWTSATIDAAIPTGSNTIGSIASITTSVTPGTAASNLGKAEDSAHTSADVGVMCFGVANESNTARANNNDYIAIATDTEGNTRIVGNRDHDAVDAGEPIKIGGKATAGTSYPTAVGSGDRTDAWFDLNGLQHVANHSQDSGCTALNDLNTDYNTTSTETNSSADVTTTGYRRCDFIASLSKTGTPLLLTITVEAKSGGNYFDMRNGFLSSFFYDDVSLATAQDVHVTFPCPTTGTMRVSITGTGLTSGVDYFTVANAAICLGT